MGDLPRRKPQVKLAVVEYSAEYLAIPEDLSIPAFLKREYDPDAPRPTVSNRYWYRGV